MTLASDESMFLVLPAPFRRKGDALLVEAQAKNGIERWADHFSSLVVACPVLPEHLIRADGSIVWIDTEELSCRERVELLPLPWAFSWKDFFRTYRRTRAKLREIIGRCRYLQFATWGLAGDWAAVAALEAIRQRRAYAIHTDNVTHELIRRAARGQSVKRRIKAEIEAPIMHVLHRYVMRRCALGLWHGYDCYRVYSAYCANNQLIHDVHTKPEDCIPPWECAAKAREAESSETLRICYAGRATSIKAPLDWVRAVAHARDEGANLQAVWLGDGPMLEDLRRLGSELKLGDCFQAPGFVENRAELLQALRHAHIMMFTHLTPESPRCLIEALVSGTPIVGYDNDYARDLVKEGGGVLVPVHDWRKLGEVVARLASRRDELADLIRAAGSNGSHFSDEAVFRERSELIKRYLP